MKNGKFQIRKIMSGIEKTYGDSELCSLLWQYAEKIRFCLKGKILFPDFFEAVHDTVYPEKITDPEKISVILSSRDGNITYKKMSLFYEYAALWALKGLDIPLRSDKELCDTLEYLKLLYSIDSDVLLINVSETERILDKNEYFHGADEGTKSRVRLLVSEHSEKFDIPEADAAMLLCRGDPFAKSKNSASRLYLPFVAGLTVLFSVLSALLLKNVFLVLLLVLPLSELSKQISDTFFSRIVKTFPIPRLKLDSIPDRARTLCVITSLITSEKDCCELTEKISDCYFSNRDKNAVFGLLLDLPEADSTVTPEDSKIITAITESVDLLNEKCGGSIFLFIRSRKFSLTEGKYMGWERKRGAIIELCRLLKGKETTISVLSGDAGKLCPIKYIITLDSDTRLYNGAVHDTVGAMLHPSNKPVIKDGIVVSGYGIMQPRMEPSLKSAEKTPFSVLSSGNGGTDIYASAAYEAYQSIFGEGIFCGKGIFDADVFSELIDGAFPDDAVLSHDLLEGTRLRAAALTDISFTDDLPKSPLSCFDRMHRWVRGDIQSLMFTGKYVRNADGDLIANPISSLSKYKIRDNVRRAFLPVSAAAAIIVSMFLSYGNAMPVIFVSLSYLLYPAVFSVLTASRYSDRRFFSYVMPSVIRAVSGFFYSVASLLETAIISADAVIRAGYRMLFSRKHMLQWKTASESDKAFKGIGKYIYRMLPSILTGCAAAIFCPLFIHKVIGILWFGFPFAAYFLGKDFSFSRKVSKNCKEEIKEYASDIWKYFNDKVTEKENFLPPDNYQLSPVEVTAHRTSPTNIGLYLLSCIAASDFGFISFSEAVTRIIRTFETLDKMQKWNGHLYNWYDTATLSVLGEPYVSTVDSGNFICCLTALKQALTEKAETTRIRSLIEKITEYIDTADFSLLYNGKRKLFAIGINSLGDKSEGCYDLMMSEARLTSYFAVASGQVPREHWKNLGRVLISRDGYMGLSSWTGTMFEFMMPELLLPSHFGSLVYEATRLAIKEQREDDVLGVWGRSESGYFEFDADMNYQYRAFGSASLGIKRGLYRDTVISPYSSFLCLSEATLPCLENLTALKKLGAYGDYGFYEAIDFTKSRVGGGYAIIRSYMAHHLGMSMIASANACFDGIFNRRFMSDAMMSSSEELLDEKIPVDAQIVRHRNREFDFSRHRLSPSRLPVYPTKDTATDLTPYASVISDGGITVSVCRDMLKLSAFGRDISVDPFVFGDIHRPRILFSADGTVYDALSGSISRGAAQDVLVFGTDSPRLMSKTGITVSGKHQSFIISFEAEGNFSTICPMLCFEPCLAPTSERLSHPAYSDITVVSEYCENASAVIYTRRSKERDEPDFCIAVSLENRSGSEEFECRRNILPLMYSEKDIENLLSESFSNSVGTLINPYCAVKKESLCESGKYRVDFLISAGMTRDEAISNLLSARTELSSGRMCYAEKAGTLIRRTVIEKLQVCGGKVYSAYSELLLSCALRGKPGAVPDRTVRIGEIWRFGISGDIPVFTVSVSDDIIRGSAAYGILIGFIYAHKYLALCGIKTDLVFICRDYGDYLSKRRNMITEAIEKCACGFMLGHSGGVFVIDSSDAESIMKSISVLYEKIDRDTSSADMFKRCLKPEARRERIIKKPEQNPSADHNGTGLTVYGGEFTDSGFHITEKNQTSPWSYVYAGRNLGTLVTQNSLGYTWIGNSHERRITPYSADALLDFSSEQLILELEEEKFDLAACSVNVIFGKGGAEYRGNVKGHEYKVTVTVSPLLPCKIIGVECDEELKVVYRVTPLLSDYPCVGRGIIKEDCGDTVRFYPAVSSRDNFDVGFLITRNFGSKRIFILGAYPLGGVKTLDHIKSKFKNETDDIVCAAEYKRKTEEYLPDLKIRLPDKFLSAITEYYLPYQALVCRMFGRSGFFQSGGAYGFRDQLQDCLCIMRGNPALARTHILRCASHQYEEGDVMHWWHPVQGESYGVRTHCSDDSLWLPYVTAEYISLTSDHAILDIELPYLTSPTLSDNENDRYERAVKSKYRESLYYHLVRSIEHSLVFGKNGLPFIGSGDWNDGMNGINGAESVWLGFFLSSVLEKMIPLAASTGDLSGAAKYREIMKKLRCDCEKCFSEDRFCRAILPDGRQLGTNRSIDILPQAFSAICGFDGTKTKTALKTASDILFDREKRIFKLLSPPYSKSGDLYPGYISAYPEGIRENGGQYTHGAVWGAVGCAEAGLNALAAEIVSAINPASLCMSEEGARRYSGEPYFLAGDVSAANGLEGRCGWSLYTGAAGWLYIAVTESLIGLKFSSDSFTVTPHLSERFPSFTVSFVRSETKYTVRGTVGSKTEYLLDGKIVNNLFYYDKKTHLIEITVEISCDMS